MPGQSGNDVQTLAAPAQHSAHKHNLLIVSDLHIGEGLESDGKLNRNEDFLYDKEFTHFLVYHQQKRERSHGSGGLPWRLIINGDVVDFLQVTEVPTKTEDDLVGEVNEFLGLLHANINDLDGALEALTAVATSPNYAPIERKRLEVEVQLFISHKQNALAAGEDPSPYELHYNNRRWGLGSTAQDNIWRLHRIYQGHPIFFQGLAWFLAMGNEIVIQTGNHDIEIFWPDVRQAFRDILKLAHGQLAAEDWRLLLATFGYEYDANMPHLIPDNQFSEVVASKLAFTHWIYYEPGVAYIEHGCQYETANSWPTYLNPKYVPMTPPKSDQDEQSNLLWPWGSLIVRYIFNRVEQVHPFVDQIKPITAYLTWAFSRDLLRSVWLLLVSIPGMLRVGHQILNRGVMEGWFGNTLSITGVFTMMLRGILIWLAWLRHPKFDPQKFSAERWKQVKNQNKARHELLANNIVTMHQEPKRIETEVLNQEPVGQDDEGPPTSPKQQALELFIWLGMVTAVLLLARWIVGWEIVADSFHCKETAVLCQLLPDAMTRSVLGISDGYTAKMINVVLFLSTVCMIGLAIYTRYTLERQALSSKKSGAKINLAIALLTVFFFILGIKVYYVLKSFSTSTRPPFFNWLIIGSILSLILATTRPKGGWPRSTSLFRGIFIFGAFLGLYFGIVWLLSTIITTAQALTPVALWAIAWGLLTSWFLWKIELFSRDKQNNRENQIYWVLILVSGIVGAIFGLLSLTLAILYRQAPLEPPLWVIALWVTGWGFLGLWLLASKENPFREKAGLQGWAKDRLGTGWRWLPSTFNSSFTTIVEMGLLLLFLAGAVIFFNAAPFFLPEGFLEDTAAKFRAFFTAVLLLGIGIGGRWLLSNMQAENYPERVRLWHKNKGWRLEMMFGLGLLGLITGAFWLLFGKSVYQNPFISLIAAVASFVIYAISAKKLKNRNDDSAVLLTISSSWYWFIFFIGVIFLLWTTEILVQTVGGVTTRIVAAPKWPWCIGTFILVFWLLLDSNEEEESQSNSQGKNSVTRFFSALWWLLKHKTGSETRSHLRLVNAAAWFFGLINLILLGIIIYGELRGNLIDLSALITEFSQNLPIRINEIIAALDTQSKVTEAVGGIQIDLTLIKNLAGILVITLALVGALGKTGLQMLQTAVSGKLSPQTLTTAEQIDRITKVAARLQQSFIRRFARIATIALSVIFSGGLILGVFLTVRYLNTGQSLLSTLGILVSLVSWAGRRLLPLIPSNLNPDGGYLLEAAADIRSILHRGRTDIQSMRDVPYFLFGHDHHPAYDELKKTEPDSDHSARQWYVNSGAWVQSYSGDVRLRREDEDQSIFVEIIVDDVIAGKGQPPSLRRWDSKLGQPMPLNRLISPFKESLPKRVFKVILRLTGINNVPYTELK